MVVYNAPRYSCGIALWRSVFPAVTITATSPHDRHEMNPPMQWPSPRSRIRLMARRAVRLRTNRHFRNPATTQIAIIDPVKGRSAARIHPTPADMRLPPETLHIIAQANRCDL